MFQNWKELAAARDCPLSPEGNSHPGFHGDIRLIEILEDYILSSDVFIETGTYLAGTLYYVASNFKNVQCYSCEPVNKFYDYACSVVADCSNVHIAHEASPDFLNNLVKNNPALKTQRCTFWLDGHGQSLDSSPLPSEINFIMSNFQNAAIFIDDLQVPEIPDFQWQFSWKYFEDIIKSCSDNFAVAIPNYGKDQTSCISELSGWGLITNREDIDFISYPVTLVKGATSV